MYFVMANLGSGYVRLRKLLQMAHHQDLHEMIVT